MKLASLIALVSIFMARPAIAFDVPMTPAQLEEAISFGKSKSVRDVLSSKEWSISSDDGQGPNIIILTQFNNVAFTVASQIAKYLPIQPEATNAMHEFGRVIQIEAVLSSSDIDDNKEAVIVIEQSGHHIQPVKLEHGEPNLQETTFYRTTDATFSTSSFRVNQPFKVIVANYGSLAMTPAPKTYTVSDPRSIR